MATGYTHDIKDGIDFRTYAMNCARAFGACVMLRDEPGGGDRIPEAFAPSDYHLKALERVRVELAELDAMAPAEKEIIAEREWAEAEAGRLARLEDKARLRASYEAMLEQARAWKAPTPDHEELRTFMCEQIEQSIDFDCGGDYDNTPDIRLTGEDWAASRRASLERDVQYHEREHASEVERAASRTEWVRALRAAL
jgi:hypothetical protein